ncbi:MAG: hypothetical protein D6781_07980, partial [Verrucomicrobia bacterium]
NHARSLRFLRRLRLPTGLLLAGLLAIGASAAPLGIGDPMPRIAGQDQHEKPLAVDASTRHVLVSFDMGTGKRANAWLSDQGAAYLPDHRAIFIANIHGMPGIGRMFALPKMRRYAHRILLADEEGLLDDIPREEKKVTVLTLADDGTIAAISFWDPASDQSPFTDD